MLVVVLNEFWATAPKSYKVLVFSAMGIIAVGIVFTVIGSTARQEWAALASLPLIGLGLVLHSLGVVVRGHKVRKSIPK